VSDQKIKIGIICGGISPEYDISILSVQNILENINKDKYEIIQLGIKPNGEWIYSEDIIAALSDKNEYKNVIYNFKRGKKGYFSTIDKNNNKENLEIDVIFPIFHGSNGEDGTIQGFLELADIPYVGSRVSASSIGIDKSLTKSILSYANVPTLQFLIFRRHQWETDPEVIIEKIKRDLGLPCVVKPTSIGSAIGIAKANSIDELDIAISKAFRLDRKVIIEKWIEKRELFCGIIGNEHPFISKIGEMIPASVFYDNPRSKYLNGDIQLIIPARISENKAKEIYDYSIKTYKIIDCCGMARMDFLMDKISKEIFLIEVNTIPGFTKKSIFPNLWRESGISLQGLIDRLVELAFERHKDEEKNKIFTQKETGQSL